MIERVQVYCTVHGQGSTSSGSIKCRVYLYEHISNEYETLSAPV